MKQRGMQISRRARANLNNWRADFGEVKSSTMVLEWC
jgi:hypothetical protein